jgi:hypothetical protein
VDTVHVFLSTARFGSFDELREFVDESYTEDGDGVPSRFMHELGLSHYEPCCVEVMHEERPTTVAELLAAASYADQWLPRVDGTRMADSAICVCAPNRLSHPQRSSLDYVGAFRYVVG